MASIAASHQDGLTEERNKDKRYHISPVLHLSTSRGSLHRRLPVRLMSVVATDPSAFLFLVSLIFLSLWTPFLGLYLKNSNQLLDLDTMKVWNSFIGNLYRRSFSVKGPLNQSQIVSHSCEKEPYRCSTVGVKLNFDVDREIFKDLSIETVAGNFSGTIIRTQIKDSGGKRVDSLINLHIMLDISKSRNECSSYRHCKIKGCVLITAPSNSTGFKDLLNPSPPYRKPSSMNTCSPTEIAHYYRNLSSVQYMMVSKHGKRMVKPSGTMVRKHELIVIYISEEDQSIASHRIYKASIVFVGLALAFLIGLTCTTANHTQSKAHQQNNLDNQTQYPTHNE